MEHVHITPDITDFESTLEFALLIFISAKHFKRTLSSTCLNPLECHLLRVNRLKNVFQGASKRQKLQ